MSKLGLIRGIAQASNVAAEDIGEKLKQERLAKYQSQLSNQAFNQQQTLQKDNQTFQAEQNALDRQQTAGGKVGQYNPGDYTPESWSQYVANKDPSVLKRYEAPQHVMIAGVPHVFNKQTGSYEPARVKGGDQDRDITVDDVAKTTSTIEQAGASGKQSGKDIEATRTARIDIGVDAAKGIPTIVRGLELLESIETGGPEAISLSVKQKLGAENADEGELSNILGKAILSQLRATFGAQFTEAEGERLNNIEASFGKNTATNKRLLNNLYQIAQEKVDQAIQDAYARGDKATASALIRQADMRLDPNFDVFGAEASLSQKRANQMPASTPKDQTTGLPMPQTQEQFNALPSGSVYIDPDDGKQYRKP